MSAKSTKTYTIAENRTRKDKKTVDSSVNGGSDGKTGLVSQQKITQALGKNKQVQVAHKISCPSEMSQRAISLKDAAIDCEAGTLQSSNISSFTDETIEEAVHKLIDINKDKLTESQLVDLISSFYLVTKQCLKKYRENSVETAERTSGELQGMDNICEGQVKFSESQSKCIENEQSLVSLHRPLTLLERKRLQWLQENEASDQLSKFRTSSSMGHTVNSAINLGESQGSALLIKDHHRCQRDSYLGGLPVGEDPRVEAELRERQRRQWLAELDQQVKERRLAREGLKNVESDSTHTQIGRESSNDLTKVESPSTASTQNDVKSTGYGRGRGLADLMGRQNLDLSAKRQQQQELKEAYAEQIREREKLRQLEREAEARVEAAAEEAARMEMQKARLRQEQEFELAQRRRQTELEVSKQATVVGAQERASHRLAVVEGTGKHLQANPQQCSRDFSRIPRPPNKSSAQNRDKVDDIGKLRRAQFGRTYTISNPTGKGNGGNEARSGNHTNKETPMVIRTESTLLPSTPPPRSNLRPTSNFLSAIADPDFAPPQLSRESVLREVCRIKENLTQRRNELRSMQQNL